MQIQIGYTIIIFIFYKILFLNKIKEIPKKVEEKVDMNEIENLRSLIVSYTFSTFRTMVYMLTSISILAVDFQIYPRSNAKTETYGVSIMDLGVGAFVIGHALKSVQKTTNESFIKTAKQSSFLVLMGLLRLISVKSVNYVEHVSEYGVHWNFFFTLALVKVCFYDD
jgi:phosphatidylinositol glycan class W